MDNLERWAIIVEELRRKIEGHGVDWDELLVVMALREHQRQRERKKEAA